MQPIPSERDPIAERDGRVSLPWRAWFDDLRRQVESGGGSTSALASAIEAICRALGSPDGTPENIPDDAGTGAVIGQASIRSFGQLSDGRVLLTLANDSEAPGATYCYGTDANGAKGWFPISDALAASANITLTVGADGVTTPDLADLTDSGTGTALVKITRDAKGRVSGTSAATTDDLGEGAGNLYHTAARVRAAVLTGLSTATNAVITAADSVLSALGKLQAQITAHVGRTDNPHSVTAAQVGAVASIVAGTNVTVDATDPQNPVVSASGAGGGAVDSVNGQTGVVELDAADVGAAMGGAITLFGAVGDGVTDDTAAVTAAEASGYEYIDLTGLAVKTTFAPGDLSKRYYNGTLLTINTSGNVERNKPTAPLDDYELARPRSKSPVVAWDGLNVLWLGTSIPHQGAGSSDSYPDLFADALGCDMDNQAWSGSHATYNVNADPFSIGTVKALSMTEDDRVAGVAAHGTSSAYDDSFDPVTKASNMTCDARIKARFAVTPFDVVVLDHAHNDRKGSPGTLEPESSAITGISKGSTTSITLATIGSIAVGDAVALEVVGIDYLNHAAARVQSVAGDTVTLNIDSSAFAGTFTSGTAYKLDRATIYGAWEFLIHYIKNQGIRAGKDTKIILAGAPSEYTNGVATADGSIYSSASYIKDVADKWGMAFFDIGFIYQIGAAQHEVYFPDNVHPTTLATRQALANHWVEWARGGAAQAHPALSAGTYIPVGTPETNVSSINGFSCYWFRIGSAVYIDGRVDVTPSAAGSCVAQVSLPVPSNFVAFADAAGTGVLGGPGIARDAAVINASPSGDRFRVVFDGQGSGPHQITFHCAYQVLG